MTTIDWYKTGKPRMAAAAKQIGITPEELLSLRNKVKQEDVNELISAILSLFDALTTVWENNGNIMADAVRDSVVENLSQLTGYTYAEIEAVVEGMVEKIQ
jgi:hypothetical protein